MRRIVAAACVAVVMAGAALLLANGLRARSGPSADALAEVPFRTPEGPRQGLRLGDRPTVAVLFHSGCSFCMETFDRLEEDLDDLEDVRLVLLTPEGRLPWTRIQEGWPSLAAASNATWGTVEADLLRAAVGNVPTPAVFVWDEEGRFRTHFVGLTPVREVREALADG